MQKQASERIDGLDVLRAFAIGAVVLIHTISGALYNVPWSFASFKIYLVLDQFSRFSVPLFVFLSGYTLTLRYKDRGVNLSEFFKKRLLRLLPWYFFWSAVIFFYLKFSVYGQSAPRFPLWKVIFLGKADYQLYFVPMVFSLYLVFPFVLPVVRKFPRSALFLSLSWQAAFYFVLSMYSQGKIKLPFFLNDQQQYLFFGTWFFFFMLGIYLAVEIKIIEFFKKYALLFLALAILALVWESFDTFHLAYSYSSLNLATRSTRLAVLGYAALSILGLVLVVQYFRFIPKRLHNGLVHLGQRSYVVYLAHTLVLRVFSTYIPPLSLLSTFVLFVLVLSVSDYLSKLALFVASFSRSKILFRKTEEI